MRFIQVDHCRERGCRGRRQKALGLETGATGFSARSGRTVKAAASSSKTTLPCTSRIWTRKISRHDFARTSALSVLARCSASVTVNHWPMVAPR